jgi:hypothetical protein
MRPVRIEFGVHFGIARAVSEAEVFATGAALAVPVEWIRLSLETGGRR